MPLGVQYPLTDETLRTKISGIKKGAKVQIIPRRMDNGDSFNAVGLPCVTPAKRVVQLDSPFYATLENFDGDVLWIRTQEYFCLKISFEDLKDVSVLLNTPWSSAKNTQHA